MGVSMATFAETAEPTADGVPDAPPVGRGGRSSAEG